MKREWFLRQVVEFFIKRAFVTSCRDGCDVTFSPVSTGYLKRWIIYQLRYTHVDDVQYPAFVKMVE